MTNATQHDPLCPWPTPGGGNVFAPLLKDCGYCELIARRLSQGALFTTEAAQ